MFKPDQTNARHCEAPLQLRPEARRQLLLHNLRFNAEVGENSSADYTLNDWQFHGGTRLFDPSQSAMNARRDYGRIVATVAWPISSLPAASASPKRFPTTRAR